MTHPEHSDLWDIPGREPEPDLEIAQGDCLLLRSAVGNVIARVDRIYAAPNSPHGGSVKLTFTGKTHRRAQPLNEHSYTGTNLGYRHLTVRALLDCFEEVA